MDRIKESKNRVFKNDLAFGKNILYAMATSSSSVYRVTGLDQIEDILLCGYVRPKNGKLVGGHTNEIFWTKGGENTFYYDKRPVLEVDQSKIKDGQLGAISLEDLKGIWLFDEKQNKYLNQIDYMKNLYYQHCETVPLENILFEKEYEYVGYKMLKLENENDIVQNVFKNGLLIEDESRIIKLDSINLVENLHEAKKIYLIRLPIKYVNLLENKEVFKVFSKEIIIDDKVVDSLDSKFIIGCYDVSNKEVILNNNFERCLSEDTLQKIREKYKKSLEMLEAQILENKNVKVSK